MTGIQIHDRREKDGISHTNKDIDWTKTSENIDLLEQQERYRTVVNNRIAELDLKRKPRSDATVMCQCLVTSDNTFFEKMSRQEQIEYFKKSFNFIKERYGEKNLVSATIHFDERTPHMHVNFVPVTSDGRLSARDLFSPKQLRALQDDYNRFVRENGYDLERGQIDSKTKHLEVEKYKIETKYNELKAKEQELKRLEQIDKDVDLKAEKGKIAYTTKEVDAIKDQNKALKVEIHKKDRVIKELENKLSKAHNSLKQAQNEIEGIEIRLDRLKDLENENRALQEYRKKHPNIDKALEHFDIRREQAYSLGNKLAECKEIYHNALDERERLISKSYHHEKMIRECDNKAIDLKNLEKDIADSWTKEKSLQAELEGLKGIFKKKAREDCKNRLEQQKKESERIISRLQADHNTKPEHIGDRLQEYTSQKENLIKEKAEIIEQTNRVEQLIKEIVYNYKYHKALSDCQQTDFREISDRINARVTLRPGDEKTFRLTQDDREQLLKDFEGKLDSNTFEKCKVNFIQQDIQERQVREQAKIHTKSISQEFVPTR